MAGSSGGQGVLALQGVNIFLGNCGRGEQFPVEIIWVAAKLLKTEHIEGCKKLVEGTREGGKFRPSKAISVPRNNANVIN